MIENHETEWKESWHDEYLKWVCAYANSHGGTLEIGRNDDGKVVGLSDIEKLLKDIPNKIRNHLGIICPVRTAEEDGERYIIIEVEPQSASISYGGRYYVRSGATTQELVGNALSEFLLSRYGKTWDDVPNPSVAIEDLDNAALQYFRNEAVESKRLSARFVDCDNATLLEKLSLVEGSLVKRAGVLLFHAQPDKFSMGAYIKIGYFEDGATLVYHDEIRGPVIMQPDKVMDLIYTKYLKGIVSFRGIQRIETFPYPYDAVREAVLNAISHRCYADSTPIQIKIFPDKLIVFGNGGFPSDWTEKDLLKSHKSRAYNPNIATTFFRAGFVEAWGVGIERIERACNEENAKFPEFKKSGNDLTVVFTARTIEQSTGERDADVSSTKNGGINGGLIGGINKTGRAIMFLMRENPTVTAQEIADTLETTKRIIEYNIKSLKAAGIIDHVGPRKSGYWVIKL